MIALIISIILTLEALHTVASESIQYPSQSTNKPDILIVDDEAEKEYQKLLDLDDEAQEEIDEWVKQSYNVSTNSPALANVSLKLKIEQKLDSVKQAYENFLKKYPNHVKARIAYASFLSDLGKEDESFKQLQIAKETDPKNPAVWNNLANYYGHNDQATNAFVHYQKAIELKPSESVYYKNYATAIYMFREEAMEFFHLTEEQVIEKAIQLYKTALELDPKNFFIANDLAQTYYGFKLPKMPAKNLKNDKRIQEIADKAIKAWERAGLVARDELEKQGVNIHIARWLIDSGRPEEARKYLDTVNLEVYETTKNILLKKLEAMLNELNSSAPEKPSEK